VDAIAAKLMVVAPTATLRSAALHEMSTRFEGRVTAR
jgi:hypothetical protein